MIGDRIALGITGLTVGALTTLAALANLEPTPRSIDIVVLYLAGALQLGLLLTWMLMPRLPRWIVAGWGLILVALGIGVIITAPLPEGAGGTPWALIGLVVVGIVTMIMAAVHSSGRTSTVA
jgi:peptidoglycan/LPS O-acetylase OafA/YrhL